MVKEQNTLQFVKNEEKYYEFIRQLRNDPQLIAGFVNQNIITPEQQASYMQKYAQNYYICTCNSVPAGFIGIVDNDLRLAVKKDFQRCGVASFMLREISKLVSDYEVKIKIDNLASQSFFEKNGFIKDRTEIKDNQELIVMQKLQN